MFDKLPGNNIQYPVVHFQPTPARPVIPTFEYAQALAKQLSGLSDQLSPLGRAERAAALAQANFIIRANGNPAMLKSPLYPYQAANYMERIQHMKNQDSINMQKLNRESPNNVATVTALTSVAKQHQALMGGSPGYHASGASSAPRTTDPASDQITNWESNIDLTKPDDKVPDATMPPQASYDAEELPADAFA